IQCATLYFRSSSNTSGTSQLSSRNSNTYLCSRGNDSRNSRNRPRFNFHRGGSWKRTGPSFSCKRSAARKNFSDELSGSFSFFMCVIKRLALTAYTKFDGEDSRQLSKVFAVGRR